MAPGFWLRLTGLTNNVRGRVLYFCWGSSTEILIAMEIMRFLRRKAARREFSGGRCIFF